MSLSSSLSRKSLRRRATKEGSAETAATAAADSRVVEAVYPPWVCTQMERPISEVEEDSQQQQQQDEEYRCRSPSPRHHLRHHPTRAAFYAAKLWPTGIQLRVRFLNGTEQQRAEVRKVAPVWCKYGNFDFAFVGDEDSAATDIRITFNDGQGSWSYVGTDCSSIPQHAATMNFGWMERGTILHEFGHAIGMIHEHQNPRAGIEWNREVVLKSLGGAPNHWTETQVQSNVLDKYNQDSLYSTDTDAKSIMMYTFPAEWTKNGFSTEQQQYLSSADKQFVNQVYSGREYPRDDDEGAEGPSVVAGCLGCTRLKKLLSRKK